MPVTLPLLSWRKGLLTVELVLGGHRLPFLLDTGYGITSVVPSLAQALGKPCGIRSITDRTGVEEHLELMPSIELQAGEHILRPTDVLVRDTASRFPADWPPVAGTVSLHTFDSRALTLDLSQRQLHLEDESTQRQRTVRMSPVRHRFSRDAMASTLTLFVPVATPCEHPLWMQLDTATNAGLWLSVDAARRLRVDLHGEGVRRKESSRGARWLVPDVRLDLLGVGPMRTRAVVREELRIDGVLGLPFLSRYLVMVDLYRGRVWLGPR